MPHNTGQGGHPSVHGIPVEATGGGYFTQLFGQAEIRVGGQAVTSMKRGLLVALVDSTGKTFVDHFEPFNPEETVEDLEAFIKTASESATIAIVSRAMNELHGGNMGQAFRWLGLPEDFRINPMNSLAIIGGRDGRTPMLDFGAAIAKVGTKDALLSADAAIGLVGFTVKPR